MYFLINLFKSFLSIQLLINIIINLIYSKRVYNYSSARKKTLDVVDALNNLNEPFVLKFGREVFISKSVPLLTLSLDTIAIASCEMSFTGTVLNVTVYRLKWGKCNGEPLVPDPIKSEINNNDFKNRKSIIKVLEKNNCVSEEITIPEYGISNIILKNCYQVASTIIDEFIKGSKCSKTYILHGYPGCGKTTTLRIITNMLEGILIPEYNATNSENSIRDIINDYTFEDSTLIIAFEEFDIYLKKIVENKLISSDMEKKPDAYDKSSWNSMLDYIKRKRNVIYVMITNKSLQDIQKVYDNDFSYLRSGRIDAHFIWPEKGNSVHKIDPVKNDYNNYNNYNSDNLGKLKIE